MKKNLKQDISNQVFSPVRKKSQAIYLPLLICSLVIFMTAVTVAGSNDKTDGGNKNASGSENRGEVEVENFGKVTDFFYRGAQPKEDEYNQLAAIGVKTIIDLRNDPKDYAQSLTERAGLKYINFPMNDKSYPATDAASKFLELVKNEENWPVYVHCAGGRHRTGAMAAVFRMTIQGWDINRAYEEMKTYDFYTRWGHKAMKQFVFDYYREINGKRGETSPAQTN
ncbi:MAG: tyrosine-protein phosphatase [Acidobacteria bacterium]|nr:tyrosine-protein phosphatase [Acidobacteriota bacterium]